MPDASFKVVAVIDDNDPNVKSGFKCLVYKSETLNEIIVAMAGTDGPNMQDWAQNLNWGLLQWNTENKKAVFDAIVAAGGNNAATKIHFTGQSLGGALAEYAAFDYWQARKEEDPNSDILNRMTLTTFNGLAGGAGVISAGKGTTEELAAFHPSQTAHYAVANDIVHRLGGQHLGNDLGNGTMYKFDFNSGKYRDNKALLLDPIDAHRIESGFYRKLANFWLDPFAEAKPYTDYEPLPVDGLQAEPGELIKLFNKGTITETSGKYRAVAALIYALNQATRTRDIDALFKPILQAIENSELTTTPTGALLLTLANRLTADDLKGAANDLRAYAVRNLLTALVVERAEQGGTPLKRH